MKTNQINKNWII